MPPAIQHEPIKNMSKPNPALLKLIGSNSVMRITISKLEELNLIKVNKKRLKMGCPMRCKQYNFKFQRKRKEFNKI